MKVLKSTRGEMVVTISVIIVLSMLTIALAMKVYPVFIAKQQLDTYATELCREAAISGRVGNETNKRMQKLTDETGLNPSVSWSKTGKIQLDEYIELKCTTTKDIGLFAKFGSFPVTLSAKASGRSEVYWK